MAQRLVRAKRKIREAGIPLRVPAAATAGRLGGVLRVVYLVFTAGHKPAAGDTLVRGDLCEQAIRLARALAVLVPGEAEVTGLLALLLLTDARRARPGQPGRATWCCWPTRTARAGTGRRSPRARPWLDCGAAPAPARPVPAAGRDRRLPRLRRHGRGHRLAARSPRCTASCSVTSRPRWSRRTGPPRWPWPRDRRPGWPCWTRPRADRRLARWPQLHIARAELLGRLGRPADAARLPGRAGAGPRRSRARLHQPPYPRAGQLSR